MDLRRTRDSLVQHMLPHVPFDGWSVRAMRMASTDAGHDRTMAERCFPGGPVEAVEHFSDFADRLLVEEMAGADLQALRMRQRVAFLVRRRIEPWGGHREAVRRAMSLLALPPNGLVALRATYRTVDTIWHLAGDSATDFSFYTKRATLAAVHTATVLYWLDDMSEDAADTWGFLDRRIGDVMQIPKLRARLDDLPGLGLLSKSGRRRRFGVRAASY